ASTCTASTKTDRIAGGGFMIRRKVIAAGLVAACGFIGLAQSGKLVPRPPAQTPGQPPPGESAAPDGYAPIPQWRGQTRAPVPAKTAQFDLQTFAEGLNGGYGLHFLPDGRIILSERGGRIKIVGKDGKVSEPLTGLPDVFAGGPQGLFEVQPDKAFATNRTLYLSYTALPEGANRAALPRAAGLLRVASEKLSADDRKLDDDKELLNAEGIAGRLAQANDGTLLITSSIPAGLGIKSEEWPQPQQLDSLMGKVLRINADGSVPKD